MLLILASIVGPVKAVGCTVGTQKTFPVVPRHGLVSYRGVPVSMVRHKKLVKAPKCLVSLITLFF